MEKHTRRAGWRTWPQLRLPLMALTPLALVYLCQLVTLQDWGGAVAWVDGHVQAVFFTYLLLLLLQLLLVAATGSLFCAAALITLPALLLSVASHLKEAVNGVPLLISDLAMAGQAGQIAGFLAPGMSLGGGTWLALALAAVLLGAAWCFSRPARAPSPARRGVAAVLLASLALNVALFPPCAAMLAGGEEESQAGRNDRLGLLAGLYSALRESAMAQPSDYSQDNLNRVLLQLRQQVEDTPQATSGLRPHVVLLVSESFFDVTGLPGVDFQHDPIPTFHALAEDFPSGTFLSNTYAGGTGNVEMELLTGIPSALLGAGEDLTSLTGEGVYSRLPSLAKAFGGQGYDTAMVHSYNDSLYNRARNLPQLGFDRLIFSDQFPAGAPMAGGYLSDAALAQQIIAQFEARGEEPLFLYGLSMENHQPYYPDKFPQPSGAGVSSPLLDEYGLASLDALVHGLSDADAALDTLTRYFSTLDEPVILVFVGDHLPGLYLEENRTIYSALGCSSSANTKDWDAQEMLRMHSTDFLVWNNFGGELAVPDTVSCTQLGSQLLGWAGLSKPLYFTWVDRAAQEMLLYRERLFVDASGTAYDAVPAQARQTVETYRSIVYDFLYGQGYITRDLTRYEPSNPD